MAAYVVTQLHLLDEQAAARYRVLAEQSVHEFGGRYLARAADALEAGGGRAVVIEFPSLAVALQWKESAAYARALAIREQAMRCTMMVVPGLAGEG